MKSSMFRFLFYVPTIIALASCVSVNIADNERQRSESVQFSDPSDNFTKVNHDQLDGLWRNLKNGNSISYLSDCHSPSDPPLKQIHDNIIRDIENRNVLSANIVSFNRRRALRSTVEGSIDGVSSKMAILVFKQNNCIYILNYVALPATYSADHMVFESFLKGFSVP